MDTDLLASSYGCGAMTDWASSASQKNNHTYIPSEARQGDRQSEEKRYEKRPG